MKYLKKICFVLLTAGIICSSCNKYVRENGPDDDRVVDRPLKVNSYLYITHDNKPMTVYYVLPPVINKNTRVLFTMHGVSRNAETMARQFRPVSAAANVAIIAPLYDRETFGDGGYDRINFGSTSNPNPYNEWAFHYLDGIFQQFTAEHEISTSKYILYGFSAGGQFTHRTYMLSTSPYLDYAIAGGSGFYTFYDDTRTFPEGIRNLMQYEDILLDNLRNRKMYIVVGGNDNDPNDPEISSTQDHQGIHRVERAQNFFAASRMYATQKSIPFNWELEITGSGGHEVAPTIPYVAEVTTRTTRPTVIQVASNLSGQERIYGTWYAENNSAYIITSKTATYIGSGSANRFVISISDFETVANNDEGNDSYVHQTAYPGGYRIRGVYTETDQSTTNVGDSFSRIFYMNTNNVSMMRTTGDVWNKYR